MTLILNILDKHKAYWFLADGSVIKHNHNFVLLRGEEKILSELDSFLKQNNFDLKNIKNIILLAGDISMTQIKVVTAMINTLGWQLDIPVSANFNYQGDFETAWHKNSKMLEKIKCFVPLQVEYKHKPNITASKKKYDFIISK
jgi:hypothetical protein